MVASFGGFALMIASGLVRQRWVRGGVYCFWVGLFVLTLGNTARHWAENMQDTAEFQAVLSALSPADLASPTGQSFARWAAMRMAQPPVAIFQWFLLGFTTLGCAIALIWPAWLMTPQDRIKLGLSPTLGPRLGGAA